MTRSPLAELLVWPALLGYGEAAVALVGETRRPGWPGRLAIWGVRVGWLAQSGLLAAQLAGSTGFPWSSRAGALNLLAWLVVGAYLIWGCRARFRLLGLTVMPLAAVLLLVAYAGGGTVAESASSGSFLALHAALMLAALAGLTFAAATSALYIWQERRLKRRLRTVLRVRVPSLAALDGLAARAVVVSLAALTAGIALGVAELVRDDSAVDAGMATTSVVWAGYATVTALRRTTALGARRSAELTLACFTLVVLTLAVAHLS